MNPLLEKIKGPANPAAALEDYISGSAKQTWKTQRAWGEVINEACGQIRTLRNETGTAAKKYERKSPGECLEFVIAGNSLPTWQTQKTCNAMVALAASEISELRELAQKNKTPKPEDPAPAPKQPAAAAPAKAQETRQSVTPPNPVVAAAKPSLSARLAHLDSPGVLEILKNWSATSSARAEASSELIARGYTVEDGKAFLSRDQFEALSHTERNDHMRAGFKLTDSRVSQTPTEVSSGTELTFPKGTGKTPRTPEQFMALSATEVSKIVEECSQEKAGREIRQEIFDAFDSYSPRSWRNDGKRSSSDREPFWQKYKEAFVYIRAWGPREATENDPAPPVSPNAMQAADFIGLPPSVVQSIGNTMVRLKLQGRNQRAELKRAYVKATPAEKTSLFTLYADSLQAFPLELI